KVWVDRPANEARTTDGLVVGKRAAPQRKMGFIMIGNRAAIGHTNDIGPSHGLNAIAADHSIVCERGVHYGHLRIFSIADRASVGETDIRIGTRSNDAISTPGFVVDKGASSHKSSRGLVGAGNGAAESAFEADDKVPDECGVGGGEVATIVQDGSSYGPAVLVAAERLVMRENVVSEGERSFVPDAGTAGVVIGSAIWCDPSLCDRESCNGGAPALADVEDPAAVIAADGQQARSRSLDVELVIDLQLAAGQRDRLPVEAGVKYDHVAAHGIVDRIPERSRPAVQVVQDRQGAEDGPVFEDFESRVEGFLGASRPLAPVGACKEKRHDLRLRV